MRASWYLAAVVGVSCTGCGGRTAMDATEDGNSSAMAPATGGARGEVMRTGGAPPSPNTPTGGASTGGRATGGRGVPPTGGSSTGGLATGGLATGGLPTGGLGGVGGAGGIGAAGGVEPTGGVGATGGIVGDGGQAGTGQAGGRGQPGGGGGAGGARCAPETTEIVVDTELPYGTTVPSLLVRDGELVLLAITGVDAGARLYRHDLDGTQLAIAYLPGGKHSQVLATEAGFVLLHAGAEQLEIRHLNAAGGLAREAFVDLDVGTGADVWVAPAVRDEVLGIAYLAPSGEPIGSHGVLHFATFDLDGTPLTDAPLTDENLILSPRSVLPTASGWTVAWVEIEAGNRHVNITDVAEDGASIVAEAEVDVFRQDLQGGFPALPLISREDGGVVSTWIDLRDEFDEPDVALVWQRDEAGVEHVTSHSIARRVHGALDLAASGDDTAVLVDVMDFVEVHHFRGNEAGPVDTYDAPDVIDDYGVLEAIPGGYALAGVEAAAATATVKLVLHRCAE